MTWLTAAATPARTLGRLTKRRPLFLVALLALSMAAAVPLLRASGADNGVTLPTAGSATAVSSNLGAFATSVPIEVPPYHGIEPNLSLRYDSLGGEGILGLGWSIGGLSSIKRVGPRGGAPTWNFGDTYELDGEALVRSTALGGTHATKRQSFRKIVFNDAMVNWTVTSTHGVVSTYGVHEKVATTSGAYTTRWMLSSVTDPHNNKVTYNYSCVAGSVCYPTTITYNGVKISFFTDSRSDRVTLAAGGGLMTVPDVVKTIDVSVGAAHARAYKLGYTASIDTGRVLLTSVRRYGSDVSLGTSGDVIGGTALPPVSLQYWHDQQPGFSQQWTGLTGWCAAGAVFYGDVTGDSFTDAVCHNFSTADTFVAQNNGDGTFTKLGSWNANFCAGAVTGFELGDLNGDGLEDLLCINGGLTVSLSTGTAFGPKQVASVSGTTPWCPTSTKQRVRVVDVNDDGWGDLVCTTKNNDAEPTYGIGLTVALGSSSGTSFTTSGAMSASWCAGGNDSSEWAMDDVNGDGYVDVVCHDRVAGVATVSLRKPGGFAPDVTASFCKTTTADTSFGMGDFNGDGKADLWCNVPDGGPVGTGGVGVSFSLGDGHFVDGIGGQGCGAGETVSASDYNGDGRTDVRCESTANGWMNIDVLLSTGSLLQTSPPWSTRLPCTISFNQPYRYIDISDDGRGDVVCWSGSGTGREFHLAMANTLIPGLSGTFHHPDLLRAVRGELSGTTGTPSVEVFYTIPHQANGYTATVVSGHRVPAVAGLAFPSASVSYTYGLASWDSMERRFLGYASVQAATSATTTTSTFRVVPGYSTGRLSQVYRANTTPGQAEERTVYSYNEAVSGGVYTSTRQSQTVQRLADGAARWQTSKTSWTYDGYGNVLTERRDRDTGEPGNSVLTTSSYTYNTVRYIVDTPKTVTTWAITSPANTKRREVTYLVDGFGAVTKTTTLANAATGATVTTSAHYDVYGNRDSSTDELGAVTTYAFDAGQHVYPTTTCQTAVTPAQCSTEGWNTTLGRRTSLTDANAQVTSWTYDVLGRQRTEKAANGQTVTTTYANWGSPTTQYVQKSTTDGTADGLWKREYLNGVGQVYKTVAEPDVTVLTEYNAQGLVSRVSNPFRTGQTPVYAAYSYDSLGRQLSVVYPGGARRTTSYLVEANAADADFAIPKYTVRECDEVNVCRRMTYDSFGDLKVTSEWNGAAEQRTRVTYDEFGQVTSRSDAVGNVTTQAWDALGRKTSMRDPDAGLWLYTYDAASHVVSQTDPRGNKIVNGYDKLGRPTTQTIGTTVVTTNRYDEAGHGFGVGRPTSMSDQSGSTSWTYDALGRVTATVKTIGTTAYTVRQAYDVAGRRASLTYPDGEVVGYTYDAMGCLKTVGGYVTAAACAPSMALATRTLGNGAKQASVYDTNRLWLNSSTTTSAAGAVLLSETYSHRVNGQISAKTSSDAADQWSYGYDSLNRLTSATNTTTAAYTSSYAYDKVGRMTSGTGLGAMVYPAANGGHVHAPSTVNGVAQTYDAAGNRTADGTTTFGYNAQNRLTSLATGGVTTTYVYDGEGTRVKAGTMVMVTLDGQLLYQNNGTTSAKFYYYGGERVARKDNTGAVSYYVGTASGSPHMVLNSAAGIARKNIYGPYGNVLNQTGALVDPFAMAGQYKDASGLYHMGARYMSPKTAAFTSPDPAGAVDVTHPQTLNRYAYALGDPVNRVDPTGNASVRLFPNPHGNVEYNVDTGQPATTIDLGHYGRFNTALPNGPYAGRTELAVGYGMGTWLHVRANIGLGFDYDALGFRGVHFVWSYSAGFADIFQESITYRDTFGVNSARTEFGEYHAWTHSERIWSVGLTHDIMRSKDVFLGGDIDYNNPFGVDSFTTSLLSNPFSHFDLGNTYHFDMQPINDWWVHGQIPGSLLTPEEYYMYYGTPPPGHPGPNDPNDPNGTTHQDPWPFSY